LEVERILEIREFDFVAAEINGELHNYG